MYEVSRESFFSAAHRLREYGGKCEALHGHNWRVRLNVRARELDELGMVLDFKVLKATLREVLERLDHKLINEVPPFDEVNPSAENLARYIAEETNRKIADDRVWVHSCEVWESDRSKATWYFPER